MIILSFAELHCKSNCKSLPHDMSKDVGSGQLNGTI